MATSEEHLNFEREPESTETRIGKHLWKLDISAEKIKETIAPLREAVEKLKGVLMARPDRAPDDYETQDDDIRRLASILERLVSRPSYNNGDSEDGGSRRLLAWILTVTSLLAVGGIGGGIVMYGEVSSLKASVTQWQIANDRRMDQTERRLDRLENRSP